MQVDADAINRYMYINTSLNGNEHGISYIKARKRRKIASILFICQKIGPWAFLNKVRWEETPAKEAGSKSIATCLRSI